MKTKTFLIILVIFSILFFGSFFYFNYKNSVINWKNSDGENFKFNVVKNGDTISYVLQVYSTGREYLIPFRHNPKELEDIKLDEKARDVILSSGDKAKKKIYITQDPDLPKLTDSESALAVVEINKVTGQAYYGIFKIDTISALTRETDRSKELELPIKTCNDASNEESVILLTMGNESSIDVDGNCVVVEGKDGKDLFRVTDKLVMHLLTVF